MKINSIMTTKTSDVISISPDQGLSAAITMLAEHNIGALIVIGSESDLVGIISERDVVRAFARVEDALSLTVNDVMTKEVITGVPEDDIMSVVHTMTERRFRHLPIVDADQLIGVISIGDILKAQRDMYRGEIDTLETQILAQD
jgi:CBS domain-containing protein